MNLIQRILAWFRKYFGLSKRPLPASAGGAARMAAHQAGVPTHAAQAAARAGADAYRTGQPSEQGVGWQVGESDGSAEGAATVALTQLPPELLADYDRRMGGGGAGRDDGGGEATVALTGIPPAAGAPDSYDSYAHEEWREMQAFVADCERRGLDLAGLDPADPDGFWLRHFALEEAEQEGRPRAQAVREQGFADEAHWELVERYFIARWSELRQDDDGDWSVRHSDAFTNAALRARDSGWQQKVAQAEASHGELFEPIAGVTLEAYAAMAVAAAGMPPDTTRDGLDAMLRSRFGVDMATYEAAANGWGERMSQDTTYALVTRYGQAFGQAQTGNANAGLAPGVAGAGGHGDAPPVSFERYCEIMAAQAVWAENGLDVNAMLQSQLGITALDYSGYSQYWAPRMGTDIALMTRYGELDAQYRQQYQAALGTRAPGALDDDLSF